MQSGGISLKHCWNFLWFFTLKTWKLRKLTKLTKLTKIINCTIFFVLNLTCLLLFPDIFLPSALDLISGTATNSVNSNYFPTSADFIGEIRDPSRYPYTYPYFLYPPSHKIPYALASHRPAIDAQNYFLINRTEQHFNHRHSNASNVINITSTNHIGWMHLQRELRKQFYDVGET